MVDSSTPPSPRSTPCSPLSGHPCRRHTSRRLTTAAFLISVLATSPFSTADAQADTRENQTRAPSQVDPGLWHDVTDRVGAEFQHWNGATGQWYFPEINGSGVALLDFDNDGDLDIYWVQGAELGHTPTDDSDGREAPPLDRLWRNELSDGELRFTDVTESSGIHAAGYGMAAAAADFDNDGWVDLYVANYGANQLWRNRGRTDDGSVRFEDVTEAWQAGDRRWTSALAVLDFDRDGFIDLYVGNYLRFEIASHKACTITSGQRDYCHPSNYPSEDDLLFRNILGDQIPGKKRAGFIDISRRAFGPVPPTPTLGLGILDADGDGFLDIYVANDDQPNRLWRHTGRNLENSGGSPIFEDDALLTGSAVNGRGRPEASMGVAHGDMDGDGDADLFVSHLDRQTNTLYVNERGAFRDETGPRGLATPSLPFTGFGTAWVDGELDGDLDLVVVNGAVQVLDELRRLGDAHPFHQTNQYFENTGGGRFKEASTRAGAPFALSEVSRGLAVGDLDNDGDSDLVISNNNGPGRVLINGTRTPGQSGGPHWLGLRLVAGSPPRDQLGAQVFLTVDDPARHGSSDKPPKDVILWRRVGVDGSYASSGDPRILLALGSANRARELRIIWPDGSAEAFTPPALDRYTTVVQGTGRRSTANSTPPNNQPPRNR